MGGIFREAELWVYDVMRGFVQCYLLLSSCIRFLWRFEDLISFEFHTKPTTK